MIAEGQISVGETPLHITQLIHRDPEITVGTLSVKETISKQ